MLDRLLESPSTGIGPSTPAETGVVLTAGLGVRGRTLLARLVGEAELIVIPLTESHTILLAIEALQPLGRGRRPASLTFGDRLTYATAKPADEPLLCLGDGFARTDLEIVRTGGGQNPNPPLGGGPVGSGRRPAIGPGRLVDGSVTVRPLARPSRRHRPFTPARAGGRAERRPR